MNKKELKELIKQTLKEFKTVKTDGPCICRTYQTQPDGSSKCVKYSPPGCNKAGRASDTEKDATKKPDSINFNEAYCSCSYNNPNGGSGTTSVAGCSSCDDDCCTSAGYIGVADRTTTRGKGGRAAGRTRYTEKDATKKPDSIKLNEAPNCRKGYTTGVEACLANHPSDMGAYDDCYDSVVSTFKKCSGKNWGASNKGRINQFDKNLGE